MAVVQKNENPEPVLAFIALNESKIASRDEIQKSLKSIIPNDHVISSIEVDDEFITLKIDNSTGVIFLADYPIPWSDLEGPCMTSWIWKDAAAKMKRHKAHFIATLTSEKGSRLEKCLLLTKIMGAIAQCHNTAGVYWGDGTVVIEPNMFAEVAESASLDNLPLLLWIEFRVQKNNDASLNVITAGLDAFGLMEIEVIKSRRDWEEIMEIAMGTAYLMLKGDEFKDGDTIGPDDKVKVKTRHKKSIWDRSGKVLRIYV